MKSIQKLPSSAQIILNGYLNMFSQFQTLTSVGKAAMFQALTASPAKTHHTSDAPIQTSVFILTLSVMAILSVQGEKMRTWISAMLNMLNWR